MLFISYRHLARRKLTRTTPAHPIPIETATSAHDDSQSTPSLSARSHAALSGFLRYTHEEVLDCCADDYARYLLQPVAPHKHLALDVLHRCRVVEES